MFKKYLLHELFIFANITLNQMNKSISFYRTYGFKGKKIVLVTDFNADFSDDQATTIINGLMNLEIELTVM